MKKSVTVLHNEYVDPGGEEAVVEAEAGLLRSRGHEVSLIRFSNAEVLARGVLSTSRALMFSSWGRRAYARVRRELRRLRPDVVHVHNFWWALSPSIFLAAKAEGVPTVMTLHNYRLICPGALLMRGGRVCEVCLGRTPWRGVPRACYRRSAAQTALVARMIDSNRRRGTWHRYVDAFIALTEFSRQKFIEGGLPAGRIHVKPNFLADDPGPALGEGEGAIFIGRLSREKGVHTLIEAWRPAGRAPLVLVGDGPERAALEARASSIQGIRFTGGLAHDEALESIGRAAFLVLPSTCYETFGRTIIEAFACGRPVVASRLGAMAEVVEDGRTGLLFEPGNARDLAEKIRFILDHPAERERMGREARAEFERRYTTEADYPRLMAIYEKAIENARATRRRKRILVEPIPEVPERFRPAKVAIGGAGVSVLNCDTAVRWIAAWAERRESRYVCTCPATGVVTAWLDREFRRAINGADQTVPDGFPVSVTLRLLGTPVRKRVYGPDLMLKTCRLCERRGWPVYLYGSTEETLRKLEENLARKFSGLRIAGSQSPHFRPLTPEEDRGVVERINASGARVVFVGLGLPKQDVWMHEHRGRVKTVMIGVGAAFDFHAGTVRQAPVWMQKRGLEWLFRLLTEPRRLWRRYFRDVPLFIALAFLQVLGLLRAPPSLDFSPRRSRGEEST